MAIISVVLMNSNNNTISLFGMLLLVIGYGINTQKYLK